MNRNPIQILNDGIPVEVALVLALIVILPIVAVLLSGRRSGPDGEQVLRRTGMVLAAAGFVVAGYVFYASVIKGGVVQCIAGGGGCTAVEKSRYSHILGIHVSAFGLGGYLLLLGAFAGRSDRARIAAFALSLFGFIFSLYLTYLELWQIFAVCQWCVTSAVLMTMLFVVAAVRMARHYGLDGAGPDSPA